MIRPSVIGVLVFCLCCFLPLAAENVPTCNQQAYTRNGNQISISATSLTNLINQRLQQSHESRFKNLQVTTAGNGQLKVSGQKDGTPMSIQGPAKATSGGLVTIHATKITKNGGGVKTLMDIFGKDLSDYLNLKHVSSISVNGNTLKINPDAILGISGQLQNLSVGNSRLQMQFASAPCR